MYRMFLPITINLCRVKGSPLVDLVAEQASSVNLVNRKIVLSVLKVMLVLELRDGARALSHLPHLRRALALPCSSSLSNHKLDLRTGGIAIEHLLQAMLLVLVLLPKGRTRFPFLRCQLISSVQRVLTLLVLHSLRTAVLSKIRWLTCTRLRYSSSNSRNMLILAIDLFSNNRRLPSNNLPLPRSLSRILSIITYNAILAILLPLNRLTVLRLPLLQDSHPTTFNKPRLLLRLSSNLRSRVSHTFSSVVQILLSNKYNINRLRIHINLSLSSTTALQTLEWSNEHLR